MPVGGAEDLFLSLHRHLPEGIDSSFVCLRELGMLGEEARRDGLPVELLRVYPTKRIHPLGIWKLSRWFRDHGIRIVHAQTYHDQLFAGLAAKLAGIPLVVHQHKTLDELPGRKGFLLRQIFRMADHVATLSEKTRLDLIARVGLDPSKVTAFPNATDPAVFHPAADRRAERLALGLDPDRFLIGSIAQLHSTKNHAATIRAAAALGPEASGARFLIFGDGQERPALEQLIAELAPDGRVGLAGRKRPIAPWLRSLDLFVLPSHWEGQPMAILQALECGIPILASRIEGNTALLGHDHPGLFDPDDVAEYARLLERAIRDQDFRGSLVAFQQVLPRPSLPGLAADLAALYRLLSPGG
jgi:glycosyltransferase involved in cell wall biosynthesis